MFKVVYNNRIGAHTVRDVKKAHVYLHSNGMIFDTPEYWPTQELAQAVLDKYQSPKAEHVWVHGDVFKRESGTVMVYLVIRGAGPTVYLLDYSGPAKGMIDICLEDATFLFNIKDKL